MEEGRQREGEGVEIAGDHRGAAVQLREVRAGSADHRDGQTRRRQCGAQVVAERGQGDRVRVVVDPDALDGERSEWLGDRPEVVARVRDDTHVERCPGSGRPFERRPPVRRRQVEFDQHEGGAGDTARRGIGRRRGGGPDGREEPGLEELDPIRGRPLGGIRRGDVEPRRLLERLALGQRIREGQRQRPAVRLVRGVRPVALVLHLEHVARQREARLAAGEAPVEPRDLERGLVRADLYREARLRGRAARMPHRQRRAGQRRRMQQHEPRPVRLGRPTRHGAPAELERVAHGGGRQGAVHREPESVHGEAHGQRRCAGLDIHHPRRDRPPVRVADDRAHRAQHETAAEADVGELVAAQHERPVARCPRPGRRPPAPGVRPARSPGAHSVVMPPSTANSAPVAKAPSSLAR